MPKTTQSIPLRILAVLIPMSSLASSQEVSFQHEVKPILSDKCFKCHGFDAENQKSDFRVHTFEEATRDLGGYAGIVPGDSAASELVTRLFTDDPTEVMPTPKSKLILTEEEKNILKRWVEQGAQYEKHWAFSELPAQVQIPASASDTDKNEIDHFISTKLATEGFKPSPETSPAKWLRRVSFDLTGLPPTLAELDSFLSDQSSNAREKQVERLLASDAYAERLTNEWLDVARYSDSYGYQVDRDRQVWPWRDWVIRSFQNNLPYSDFITHQLAGDLIPNSTHETKLATTFNRLHGQKVEGGSVEEEFRQEYIADRANTVGTAFMGLTMECSKCHDHKYDPITQVDYFSLSAFFNNIDESGLYAFYYNDAVPTPTLDLPKPGQQEAVATAQKKVAIIEQQILDTRESSLAEFKQWLSEQGQVTQTTDKLLVEVNFDQIKEEKVLNSIPTENEDLRELQISPNTLVPGLDSQAIKFTGDDPLSIPQNKEEFDREQPFTYSLSFYLPKTYARAMILTRGNATLDAASRGQLLSIDNGKLTATLAHFWPGNAISIQSKDPLAIETWHHLAWTYDGSSRASGMTIYLNGDKLPTQISRDKLTRSITGKGTDKLLVGALSREKGFKNGLLDDLRVYSRALTISEVRNLAKIDTPAPEQELSDYFYQSLHQPSLALNEKLQTARKELYKAQNSIAQIMTMKEFEGERRKHHVLNRGLYTEKGEEVLPSTPGFLTPLTKSDPSKPATRLDLANWLIEPNNPLAARVAVNRYWQMLFGKGLVETSEDFGNQGSLPTHPELLDWLARDFIENGWDLHHLFKKIVLSHTYRQTTSATPELALKDPENKLLARANSTPLTAEMIRDNALAVSNLLGGNIGGNPVKPYDIALAFASGGKSDSGPGLYRRSLYTYWKVNGPSPLMLTLDAAKRSVCTVRREKTASPLQSLVLLNSPQFVEAARVTAENLLKENTEAQVFTTKAFRMITSRLPSKGEQDILAKLYQEQLEHFEQHPDEAKEYIATGNTSPNGEQPHPKLAALTALVSTLLNFDECNRSY